MVGTRTGLHYLQNEQKRQQLKGEIISYLKTNSELSEEEKTRFINCYLQENTIETTAYKLNRDVKDIAILYYSITTSLARASFASTKKN